MAKQEGIEQAGERRDRYVRHTACFTPIENALLLTRVAHAGVSISSLLKCSSLDFPLPRTARRPTIEHEDAMRLVGELGQLATCFYRAVDIAGDRLDPQAVETAMRDLSEYRLLLFNAAGRKP
jgi:hypothetical protein